MFAPEHYEQRAYLIAAGIAAILLIAPTLGKVLELTVAKRMAHPGIDNLNARIRSWWVLVLLIGVALYLDRVGSCLLFAIASYLALRELMAGTRAKTSAELLLTRVAFFVVLPAQYVLVILGEPLLLAMLIPIYVIGLAPIVARLSEEPSAWPDHASSIQWGLIACVYCISYVPAILVLESAEYHGPKPFLILFLLIVTQSSDVLQYLWGKLAGRHRISPTLSPTKTVEGTVGGILSATAIGGALHWLTPLAPIAAASVAFIIALAGFLGGLMSSALKRRRGIKDWAR